MKRIVGYMIVVLMLASCSGEEIYKGVIESRVKMANLSLKEKDLGNGLQMRYYENDVKSDKTLVLLHGFTDNKETWLLFAHGLANKYHLIIPDQIGYGQSSSPMDIDYSLQKQTDRLDTFLSSFPEQNFVLVGNSMGGGVALKYASQHPVENLVLVDSVGMPGTKAPYFSRFTKEEKATVIYGVSNRTELLSSMHVIMERVPFLPPSVIDYLTQVRQHTNALIEYQTPFVFDDNLDVRNELLAEAQMIDVPTLIVWGNQDKLIHVSSAYHFKETIPNSRLKIYRRVGHAPMQEVPYRLARDVRRFLR